ncbi:hypothetical protein L3X38_000320 [Prunus dulcis]|uniref:Uncharacterized protein n=1 Tax=Prunus dulcis TaxID=3755 RepID=A0AAD4US91_PRUDU|nr:hypothetical protein L3X38_000320 [Prunus dulcis]
MSPDLHSRRSRPIFTAADLPPPTTVSVEPGTRGQADPQDGPSEGCLVECAKEIWKVEIEIISDKMAAEFQM